MSICIFPKSLVPAASGGVVAFKDDPLYEKYAKYIKMKKMNLPDDAIMQKFMKDGIPESDFEILNLDINLPLPDKFRSSGAGVPRKYSLITELRQIYRGLFY